MKLKLKLTKAEFSALHDLLSMIILDARPEGLQSKMLHSILCDVYQKFYNKNFFNKPQYTISLNDHEAIGFWLFFQKYQFSTDEIFECNLVHTINNSIHQKFCS